MGGSSSRNTSGADTSPAEEAALGKKPTLSLSNQAVDEEVLKDKYGGPIALHSRYVKGDLARAYAVEPKILGTGMSGPVQLATGRKDKKRYAVKTFKKDGLSKQRLKEMTNEVMIYLSLDHPKIARLENVYESETELHLVMEHLSGGELYDRLAAKKQYTEQLAASTAYQMLLAVNYLHSNNVVHRDLKLENWLYEAKDTDVLKLIDFGFAKFWNRSTRMSQACGSVHYVAPEVLAHNYTNKADMWSVGVIVFMLCTGSPPFHGSDKEVIARIREAKANWNSSRFRRLSSGAQEWIRSLLVKDATQRPSASEALEHPWISASHASDDEIQIDREILRSLRDFTSASAFRRAVLTMVAWSLSSEDTVELRVEFEKLDQDKSGTISSLELKQVLEEHFDMDEEIAANLFERLDSSNDERISYSEFLAAAMQHRVLMHQDVLRKAFERFDTDHTGYLTVANLREVIGPDYEGESVEDLVKEVDEDEDGRISIEEFLQFFQRDSGRCPTPKHHQMIHSVLNDNFFEHCEGMVSPTFHGQKSPLARRKGARPCMPRFEMPSQANGDSGSTPTPLEDEKPTLQFL